MWRKRLAEVRKKDRIESLTVDSDRRRRGSERRVGQSGAGGGTCDAPGLRNRNGRLRNDRTANQQGTASEPSQLFSLFFYLFFQGAHLESRFAVKLARETPLEFAVSICRFAIAELLIAKGAKANMITFVDLSMPNVTAVPLFVGKLPNLKILKLNDSILASVPASVRKKGDREILHYFQDLAADELIPYRSAKVMVLGKEGVGKVCYFFKFFKFFKFFQRRTSRAASGERRIRKTFRQTESTWLRFDCAEWSSPGLTAEDRKFFLPRIIFF
jgi:hypothetical protein